VILVFDSKRLDAGPSTLMMLLALPWTSSCDSC